MSKHVLIADDGLQHYPLARDIGRQPIHGIRSTTSREGESAWHAPLDDAPKITLAGQCTNPGHHRLADCAVRKGSPVRLQRDRLKRGRPVADPNEDASHGTH